jgi:hypothetical protein
MSFQAVRSGVPRFPDPLEIGLAVSGARGCIASLSSATLATAFTLASGWHWREP